MSGWFITLEGGEGAGKTSVLAALSAVITQRGRELVRTREPGGTPLAEALRATLLDPAHAGLSAKAELLLMYAARIDHLERVIRPALARGAVVLSDRFHDASFAYQGGGRGVEGKWLMTLNDWALDGCEPNLTLLLDVPVALGLARARGRGELDRIEREREPFFERVRNAYLARAAAAPARFVVIDAQASIDEVTAMACAALTERLDNG
jgi:dTMP kinase